MYHTSFLISKQTYPTTVVFCCIESSVSAGADVSVVRARGRYLSDAVPAGD